jgi:hypothetical protein
MKNNLIQIDRYIINVDNILYIEDANGVNEKYQPVPCSKIVFNTFENEYNDNGKITIFKDKKEILKIINEAI